MPGEMNPEALLDGMREALRSEWEQHRRQSFNNNTKGAAYENALQGFLLEYLDTAFNIHTRTAIVDGNLECFETFTAGENEFDVVATFQQAVPGIILKSGEMKWVPYDAVSFICEVKSKLTKNSLEDDISKLGKVDSLNISKNRFGRHAGRTKLTDNESGETVVRDLSVEYPLKCLVYDEESISGETLLDHVHMTTDMWDIILLVERDLILVSPELPFVEGWYSRIEYENEEIEIEDMMPDVLVLPDGLIWFIILISISIPRPIPFDTSPALLMLVQGEYEGGSDSYSQIINSFPRLLDGLNQDTTK